MLVKAQGATEYLVLLAVVLIVALVSVALLGFFPGMASDSQITQSQMYWKSATPVSVVESAARVYSLNEMTYMYLRFRNSGATPIRITGIVGADGTTLTTFYGGGSCGAAGYPNISDYFYLGPGEEKYFASWMYGAPCDWRLYARTGATAGSLYAIGGASSLCQNSTSAPGTLDFKTLGFEYIAYIEGQQIAKKQIGKDFIVKCGPPA
jgi:hypothetical protein